jgi:hypothetical protein
VSTVTDSDIRKGLAEISLEDYAWDILAFLEEQGMHSWEGAFALAIAFAAICGDRKNGEHLMRIAFDEVHRISAQANKP